MGDAYQLSFDDLKIQNDIHSRSGKTAYIDECGCFGFDFSKAKTSRYYILCAIVVEDNYLGELEEKISKVKNDNGFVNTEMKSNTISNISRRSRIISQLLPIDFKIILLIADKQEFVKGSPLTEYKKSFIKYLHQRLYNRLYHVYPKLKIIEDETGSSEFQKSFRDYVKKHRPQINLYNDYDFDYTDSKNEILVQLADIIAGSINQHLVNESAPNYLEMLKGKILSVENFPNHSEPYWGTRSPEDYKFDKDIYALSIKCARDYISKHKNDKSDEKRAQVAFLEYLLFYVLNINPTQFIYSNQIISVINEFTEQRINKNFLYRKVIAPLRDNGIIIASSSHGYKIPISVDDIMTYFDSTIGIVNPMLHRMGICRQLILQKTDNNLDILDKDAYVSYKRYFD